HDNKIYITSGASQKGANPKINTQEVFTFQVTAAHQKHHNQNFSAFPNPCKDVLNLSVNTTNTQELWLEIFNTGGTSCLKTPYIPEKPILLENNLMPGLHMLMLYTNTGETVGKVMFVKE